jgi:predicted transcriptional regulator
MASSSKSAPLETFLTGVSGAANRNAGLDVATTKKSAERSKAEMGRTVVLTILSQAAAPIARDELASRAELDREWYEQIVGELEAEGLIEQSGAGYALTAGGRDAAEQARSRLLSPW